MSGFQAWVRQEIVDDDPWDSETLHPVSSLSLESQSLEKPVLKESDAAEPNAEETTF
ncbi:MAG: hypothetical protein HC781_08525 [Leptolyngbyaceae cyanobacterium CSU_1_4]|nr:hypothetical protein [Leptolyngbyaceae cyanobacterium CSU_1_4]